MFRKVFVMSTKLKLTVLPKENNEYIVKFNDSFLDNLCCFGKCLSRNCCRLVILLLLVLSFCLTIFVFRNVKDMSFTDKGWFIEESVETIQHSLQHETKTTKIRFSPQSFYLVYIIILVLTDTALIILFIKDDSGLRYAKLDELHSIKDKIDCFENSHDKNNTSVEEKQNLLCNSAACQPVTTKTIRTETSNRTALLKHYMSCIAEV